MADSPTLQAVLDQRRVGAFRRGRVLAAVSGGADSLALLRILLLRSPSEVVVGHVNHQMRGEESEADEAFVREVCDRIGVPFVSRRVQVLGDSNVEARARERRYAALAEMAHENDCWLLATGHTANDVLETMLLHLLRGATVSGLRGIEPSRLLSVGGLRVSLVRPLLEVGRAECEAICREAGWEWRHDSSNASPKYLRNRVRNEVVPLLENLIAETASAPVPPGRLARQAARSARLLGDDLRLLDALALEHLEWLCVRREDALLVLDGLRFRSLPIAMQRRVLRLAAQEAEGQDGVAGGVSSLKIEEARAWIVAGGRRCVWQWKKNLRVEWCGAGSGNRIRLARVELGDTR